MINRYVAPGLFGEHGRPKLKPLPADRPNLNLSSHSDSGSAAVINSLLKRINSLESKQASTTADEQGNNTKLPIRESSDAASTGKFVKSRFYGQSHWMNSIEPVRELTVISFAD